MFFSDNKIIAILNNKILNTGNYDNNCIFKAENIIFSKEDWKIKNLIDYIVKFGINSLNKANDLITFNVNTYNSIYQLQVHIEKIIEGKISVIIDKNYKGVGTTVEYRKNYSNDGCVNNSISNDNLIKIFKVGTF